MNVIAAGKLAGPGHRPAEQDRDAERET